MSISRCIRKTFIGRAGRGFEVMHRKKEPYRNDKRGPELINATVNAWIEENANTGIVRIIECVHPSFYASFAKHGLEYMDWD